MNDLLLYSGIVFLLLILVGNFFTFVIQEKFLFFPEKLEANYRFRFAGNFKELFISTPFEGKINALWFKDKDFISPKGVILYFHGNADSLKRWGHLYQIFVETGYDFFIYDYRTFGKSRGHLSENTFHSDAKEMYRFLLKHYPQKNIILYGRSLGSGLATRLAATENPKFLILETPFSCIRDLFYTYYPILPKVFKFKFLFKNNYYIQKVSIPILIFQGTKDRVVPYKNAIKLKPLIKKNDKFVTIEGGTHGGLAYYDIYHTELKKILT